MKNSTSNYTEGIIGLSGNVFDNSGADGYGSIDNVAGSDLVLALYGVICALGIAGNLLVCIVLLRVPSLRSNTSHFLVHLSLVDLVVCVLVIPFKIVPPLIQPLPPLHPGFLGQLWCRLYVSQYSFWVCAVTSVFSLVTVYLERFVAIVYPHKYKRVFGNRRNKLLIIASCWVLAALTKSSNLFLYNVDAIDGCRFLGWPGWAVQAALGVYNFTLNLFAPFVLMVSLQWKVISTLKRQVHTLTGGTASLEMNPADQRRMWQLRATQTLVRTLLAFVLTFAACWFPNQFMYLLYNFGVKLSFTSPIYHFGIILALGNSCVNPIIYTTTNQPFRRGIREAFQRGKRSARVDDGAVASSRVMSVINV